MLLRSLVLAISSGTFFMSLETAFANSFDKAMESAKHGDFSAVILEISSASPEELNFVISSKNVVGDTLAHIIARNELRRPGNLAALREIVGKITDKEFSVLINSVNNNGNTLLHELAMQDYNLPASHELIEALLLRAGDARPLILATKNQQGLTLRQLVEKRRPIDFGDETKPTVAVSVGRRPINFGDEAKPAVAVSVGRQPINFGDEAKPATSIKSVPAAAAGYPCDRPESEIDRKEKWAAEMLRRIQVQGADTLEQSRLQIAEQERQNRELDSQIERSNQIHAKKMADREEVDRKKAIQREDDLKKQAQDLARRKKVFEEEQRRLDSKMGPLRGYLNP